MNAQVDVNSSWCPEPTLPRPARRTRPLRPDVDPFYVPPAGFESLMEGTLLRSREVEVAFLGIVSQQVAAWQLLYRSTDLNGDPEATVTTVLLPAGADPSQPRPLLAYQCAIDAISTHCFPSYVLQRGARSLGSTPGLELLLIAGALRRGWAVSIADHEGINGYFGAPREPGYRVLDGIRAAFAFGPLGLSPTTPVGVFGYSGGGMASSWVAEMAPTYAPEINLVGAVLGAPVGDPGEAFIKLNAGFYAGLPALVVAGLRHVYPDLAKILREHATLDGLLKLDLLETLTPAAAIARFRHNDFDDYLDVPLADILATQEIRGVFEDIRMGVQIPTCPLFVVQGVHDQIISVDEVDTQVEKYVDGGAQVTYVRDRFSEHLLLMIVAMPQVFAWLEDRFEDRPVRTGTRTVWSMAFTRRALRGYLAMAAAAGRTVFARPL